MRSLLSIRGSSFLDLLESVRNPIEVRTIGSESVERVSRHDDEEIARCCVLSFVDGINSISKKTFAEEMEWFMAHNTYARLEEMDVWQKFFHLIYDAAIELGNHEVASACMRWRLTGKF